MEMFTQAPALLMLFTVIMALVWFFLPFAVFGIKSRLDDLIKLQRANYKLLARMAGDQPDTTRGK